MSRFSKLIAKSIRLMGQEDAEDYVGGALMLSLFEKAGWVQPACKKHKLVRYDSKALDAACDRLSGGEWPEPLDN